MKLLYLAALLFLGVAFARNIADAGATNKIDDSSEEWTLDPNSTEKISAKCKEVGGEAAAKKFQIALQSTISCLNSQAPKTKEELKQEINPSEEDKGICSKRRKAIRGCFIELVEAAKECSVEQEKYAPEFFFDALDSLLEYICADDAKFLQDVINNNQTWICVSNIIEKAVAGNLTYVCTNNFKLLHDTEDNIITKPELCEDLHSAKKCYSEYLTNECPEAKQLNQFLVGVFESVSSPCKSLKTKRQLIEWDIL